MGALIGKDCVTDDGRTVGTIVYLDRDRKGHPQWIDVAFDDDVRRDHGLEHGRVRFPAGLVADREGGAVELSVDLDGLRARSSPSQPVEIEEPTL